MGYRLYYKENGVFIEEFTHQHLAEKRAKQLGERVDFTIDYVKKEEGEFCKESVCLFDAGVTAFQHDFIYDMRHRR